jgi:hypothetical protein
VDEAHKNRLARVEENIDMGGIVDEMWIGGWNANKNWERKFDGRGEKGAGKTPIIGAAQRKGNVVTRVLDHVTSYNVQSFVREIISNKISLLTTDESTVYDGLVEYPVAW